MAAIENENIYGLMIRESANDGSDFTNADADYRKLFLGETGGLFTRDSAGTIHNIAGGVGTAFPATPGTNSRFFRTDLGMEFYYDGTRWLTTTLYHLVATLDNGTATAAYAGPSATLAGVILAAVPGLVGGSDLWLHNLTTQFLVAGGTALDGSNNWVNIFGKRPTGNTTTTIITVTVNSGSSSVWRTDTQSIGALLNNGTTHYMFSWGITKTGTPGPLWASFDLTYRIVAT
jgi:hypothetical protein